MRIEIIRTLRLTYPDTFVGGIKRSKYSITVAPDLILPKRMTQKVNYLKLMKQSDICIGSMGLCESTGWKTAEYVAAGKAIVCEKLHYTNPGDFRNGNNYLEFECVEQCLKNIEYLIANPQEILRIKQNHHEYYCKFLRPDMLVKNAISHIIE